jgi:hypothetical protein
MLNKQRMTSRVSLLTVLHLVHILYKIANAPESLRRSRQTLFPCEPIQPLQRHSNIILSDPEKLLQESDCIALNWVAAPAG